MNWWFWIGSKPTIQEPKSELPTFLYDPVSVTNFWNCELMISGHFEEELSWWTTRLICDKYTQVKKNLNKDRSSSYKPHTTELMHHISHDIAHASELTWHNSCDKRDSTSLIQASVLLESSDRSIRQSYPWLNLSNWYLGELLDPLVRFVFIHFVFCDLKSN